MKGLGIIAIFLTLNGVMTPCYADPSADTAEKVILHAYRVPKTTVALASETVASPASRSSGEISSTPSISSNKEKSRSSKRSGHVILHRDPSIRGWDYIVNKLRDDGLLESEIKSVYSSKHMPVFTFIPFSLAPKESHVMYSHFLSPSRLRAAQQFIEEHTKAFTLAEKKYKVNRYIIAALLLIETGFGQNTGKEMIVYRLSRLASVADPKNIEKNFSEQLKRDSTVTLDQVHARGRYLEETFFPEVKALFEITRKRRISVFSVKGSGAGAFGIPQFLPSSYLKFGVDGNKDRVVSLFDYEDAIFSAANFLAYYGWNDSLPDNELAKVIWRYNHSDAYVQTALQIESELRVNALP